jgi:hypothetical protein
MAGPLIKPKINRIFADKITQLTKDLSKRSTTFVVIETKTDCPNCVLDPTNKSSTGKYNGTGPKPFTGKTCPVCKGRGFVVTEKRHKVDANVKWGKGDKANVPMSPGFIPEGMARLKGLVVDFDKFRDATYFLVDGIRCSREGEPKKRGLQSYVTVEQYVKIDK